MFWLKIPVLVTGEHGWTYPGVSLESLTNQKLSHGLPNPNPHAHMKHVPLQLLKIKVNLQTYRKFNMVMICKTRTNLDASVFCRNVISSFYPFHPATGLVSEQ